jgi:hypothetical protein
MSDQVVFAPTDVAGPLPSIVALSAALSSLVQIAAKESNASVEKHQEEFQRAFIFLISPDVSEPPEEEE